MIQVSPQSRILFYSAPVDFRKGIDTLCGLIRMRLGHDPFSGNIFVFFNRRRTTLKILTFDGQGFWLMLKRLSRGNFKHLPITKDTIRHLMPVEFMILIHNGDYQKANLQPYFRPIRPDTVHRLS